MFPTLLKVKHLFKQLSKTVKLRILILNAPCGGYGDVIFAMKLATYIKKWYGITPLIATTNKHSFIELGVAKSSVISLIDKKQESTECRRFGALSFEKKMPLVDLVMVAPVTTNHDPSLRDVKKLLPYATKWNTIFFSEYNHSHGELFTFNMGVGANRDGILLDPIFSTKVKRSKKLPNKYAYLYIAAGQPDTDQCALSFIKMVSKKYATTKQFDIVVPPSITITPAMIRATGKYFSTVVIQTKDSREIVFTHPTNHKKSTLTFRQDILPQPYRNISSLIKYSVREILVTGDQSISDVIGCCSRYKLPFYQIVPWKRNFSKELARNLPQKFIRNYKTSCGTMEAISYQPKLRTFVKRYNFTYRGKSKLDLILQFLLYIKKGLRTH